MWGNRERADALRARMSAAGRALPVNTRLGVVDYRDPSWGPLVFPDGWSAELIASRGLSDYGAQPLFRAVGIRSSECVPSERELLWELLGVADTQAPIVFLNPAVCSPMFPARPVRDAVRSSRSQAGRFNPNFLDPRLFRDAVFPVLANARAVCEDARLRVVVTIPALLEQADIPPYPLIWRLERLATVVPDGIQMAIEIREPRYINDDFRAFIRESGWLPVLSTWPGMPPLAHQRLLSEAEEHIVRLSSSTDGRNENEIGVGEARAWLPSPRPELRRQLTSFLLDRSLRDSAVTVLAGNDFEGCAPLSLLALAERLVEESRGLETQSHRASKKIPQPQNVAQCRKR